MYRSVIIVVCVLVLLFTAVPAFAAPPNPAPTGNGPIDKAVKAVKAAVDRVSKSGFTPLKSGPSRGLQKAYKVVENAARAQPSCKNCNR